MRLYMIAVIKERGKIIGFRIFDADSKDGKFMNVPIDNVKAVLESGMAQVENLGLVDGEIIGTNGSLERYPVIDRNGNLLSKVSPLIILSQIGDVGYRVVDYKGTVKKARVTDVVEYAKKYGIANGKVVMRNNIEFVSSIVGSYPIEKVAKGKYESGDDPIKVYIHMKHEENKPKNKFEKNREVEVDVQIQEHDVFEAMTETQKKVLKDYYIWYTVKLYKSMAKTLRLKLAPGKLETMTQLRGVKDWEFGGVWDAGFFGADQCTLGHKLRYVFYAVPSDAREDKSKWLKFGRDCASDFFSIDPKDMDKLVKTQKVMSEEIKTMADILANGLEKEYYDKAKLLYEVLRKLRTPERIKDVFGEKVGDTLINFMLTKMPFPMSLVIEAANEARKDRTGFFYKLFPEHSPALNEIFGISRKNNSAYVKDVKDYLDFIIDNKIEGAYAYNPLDDKIKRRDVGRYNKKAREQRLRLLSRFRRKLMCTNFDYEEIDNLLYVMGKLFEVRDMIEKILGAKYSTISDQSLFWNVRRGVETFCRGKYLDENTRNARLAILNALLVIEEARFSYMIPRCYNMNYDDFYNIETLQEFRELLDKANPADIKVQLEVLRDILEPRKEETITVKTNDNNNDSEDVEVVDDETDGDVEREESQEKDKTEILRELIEQHPEIPEDYGITVAKAILKLNKPYNKLTPRQQWRIDRTIEIYQSGGDGVHSKGNMRYNLDVHPEIRNKIEKIINMANSDEMKEVLKEEPNAVKIAQTIQKMGFATDRQMKRINHAIEILEKQ